MIVIPPPNVTGSLHIGHALTNAIEVRAKPALWLVWTRLRHITVLFGVSRQLHDFQVVLPLRAQHSAGYNGDLEALPSPATLAIFALPPIKLPPPRVPSRTRLCAGGA